MPFAATSSSSTPRTLAGSSRNALVALLTLVAAAPAVAQQRVVLSGRIVRLAAPADTVGVAGARVVLHRVSTATQGPLDSVRTAPSGGFRFATPRDTTGLYLISASYAGIEFFSDAIRLDPVRTPEPVTLLVSDTSSVQPVRLTGRYVVIGAPDSDRRRTIVDLFVIQNPGVVARVSPDSLTPTWRAVLPGAASHRVPDAGSEISPQAVEFRGDTVLVFAPISPGTRQLLVEHAIAATERRFAVPVGPDSVPMQMVTEEPGATVLAGSLDKAESQVVDGRPLERWTGTPVGGSTVEVALPGAPRDEGTAVFVLAALAAVALILGAGLGIRRRHLAAPGASR